MSNFFSTFQLLFSILMMVMLAIAIPLPKTVIAMMVMILMIALTISLISYYSDDSDDEVPYWLFLARDRERTVEPKTGRHPTRSTRGVNHNPFRLPTSAVTRLPI